MQLSTNLPCGPSAIEEHLVSGQSLRMNVFKEADAAVMRELEENDHHRFARLHSNVLKVTGSKAGWIVGKCTRCQSHIYNAPFLSARELGTFCSRACRDQNDGSKTAHRTRHFTNCAGCGRRFLARRTNNTTCSAKCRQKVRRARMFGNLELAAASQIPENAPSSSLITHDLHA